MSDPGPRTHETVVLLVDDQPIVGEALRQMLRSAPDLVLHVCTDAAAGQSRAEALGPSAILQDLVMPGTDGFEMLRRFREHPATASVPVIVLSSREDPKDKSRAFAAGASDYLVKLPDPIELVARLRAHARSFVAQRERDAAYRQLEALHRQLAEKNAELERLSTQDGLTGIANRRRFDDALENEWRRARRDGTPLALLMIDVDFFKRYNDHYGHLAGDDCLRRVAGALREGVKRPADLVARYGGEEFAVLLGNTDGAGAAVVAERLRQIVELLAIPHARNEVADCVTVSLGSGAARPRGADTPATLVAAADAALYEAKRAGRNRHRAGAEVAAIGA